MLVRLSRQSNEPDISSLHRVAYYECLDADMARLAETAPGVRYVSYFKMLCAERACLEYADAGVPLQSDYGHLTARGSLLVAAKLRNAGALNLISSRN